MRQILWGGGGHNYILEQVFISDEIALDSYEIYLDNGTGRLQNTSQNTQNTQSTSHISHTALESSAKSPLESAPHNTNLNAQSPQDSTHSSNLAFDSLDNLIIKHHFAPNLIKIDTDGFDFKVIRSAFETLKAHKSAIYFEWDAQCLAQNSENPVSIFSDLAALGYEECVIFDNFGNLLCVEKSANSLNLGLLSDYMQDCNQRIYYFDVLLFHKDKPLDAREFVEFVRKNL